MPLSIFSGIAHGRNDLIETAVAAAATRETLAGQRKPNQSYTHITVWDLQKQILIDKVVFLLTLTGTVTSAVFAFLATAPFSVAFTAISLGGAILSIRQWNDLDFLQGIVDYPHVLNKPWYNKLFGSN